MGTKNEDRHDVHLTVRNHGGSVEHYYHFLIGFFVPVVLAREAVAGEGGVRRIYIRSCAIMDTVMRAAAYPELVILDKDEHQAMRERLAETGGLSDDGVPVRLMSVEGYDSPDKYDRDVFTRVSAGLHRRLAAMVRQEEITIAARFPRTGPKVVLIDRAPPDAFYESDACEIKTAGRQRRSVPNFAALEAAVRSRHPNTITETLEGKSLFYQMALFRHADIIVAQHGAAMGNLIWGREECHLVEIMPQDMPELILNVDYFGNLARCLGQTCVKIEQEHSHSPVDPGAVLAALEPLLAAASPPRPTGLRRLAAGVRRLLSGGGQLEAEA